MIISALIILLILVVYLVAVPHHNNNIMQSRNPTSVKNSTELKTFSCIGIPGLTFKFPIFSGWKFEKITSAGNDTCLISLRLPESEKSETHLHITATLQLPYYSSGKLMLPGETVILQGKTKDNLSYVVYGNNMLMLDIGGEKIITIEINDKGYFGVGPVGGGVYIIPIKQNGFDINEFWKEVVGSLQYSQ